MIERIKSKTYRTVAIGALVGIGISGCSSPKAVNGAISGSTIGPRTSQPFEGVLHCSAQDVAHWQSLPSNFNIPSFASAMNVTQSDLARDGLWGPAECTEGIMASQAFESSAIVQNIGTTCVTFGLQERPEAGQTYHDVLAVCMPGK